MGDLWSLPTRWILIVWFVWQLWPGVLDYRQFGIHTVTYLVYLPIWIRLHFLYCVLSARLIPSFLCIRRVERLLFVDTTTTTEEKTNLNATIILWWHSIPLLCVCSRYCVRWQQQQFYERERESLAFENPCRLTSISIWIIPDLLLLLVILSAAVALSPPFCWVVFFLVFLFFSLYRIVFFFFCSDNYSNECMRRDGGKLNWQSLEKSAHTHCQPAVFFFFFPVCAFVVYGVISCWATNVTDQIQFCSGISSTTTKEFRNFFIFVLFIFLLGWTLWGWCYWFSCFPRYSLWRMSIQCQKSLSCVVLFFFFLVLSRLCDRFIPNSPFIELHVVLCRSTATRSHLHWLYYKWKSQTTAAAATSWGLFLPFFFSKLTWLLIYWMIEIVVMELFSFLFLSRWQERITTTDSARRVLFFPRHADTIFVFLILGVKFWGLSSQMCLILFSRTKWNVVLWSPPWRATWRPLL